MTDAERQRRVTARRKEAGMVHLRFWVPAAAANDVKQAVAEVLAAGHVALADHQIPGP